MKKVRTRYAPSPTGYLHIGGARTALFSYLYAKHYDGEFILRIEDTDVARNVIDGEKSQLENLMWLGITPDESPLNPNKKYGKYRQSEKISRYNELIDQLIENKKAYKAFDSVEELEKQKQEQEEKGIHSFRYDKNWLKISNEERKKREELGLYTVRLSLPQNKEYKWDDIVRGNISVNTNDIGDWVIKKQNGYPTYNFAVVVDDFDMEISHVLRGEEHITNTPKQLAIYDMMGWEPPIFGHLTIITNMEGKKLSKRDTTLKQFIEDYRKEEYPPHAIFNFLSLLGWTHPQAKEKLSHKELIDTFDPKRLSKSPSKFDINKMGWFGKTYMKEMDNKKIIDNLKINNRDIEWINLFVETYKQSAKNIKEIKNSLELYKNDEINKIKKTEVVEAFFKKLNESEFTIENISKAIKYAQEKTNEKGKNLFMPIRLATTYQEHGPELAKAIFLYGEKLIKERLK